MKYVKSLVIVFFLLMIMAYPVYASTPVSNDILIETKSATLTRKIEDIELSKTSVSLMPEETYKMSFQTKPTGLTLPEIMAVSSNPEVVTIDGSGLMTAVSAGSAEVTFTTMDGLHKQICTVEVEKAESTKYSLLIIISEVIILLAVVIFFLVIYRSFIKMRIKDEMKLK